MHAKLPRDISFSLQFDILYINIWLFFSFFFTDVELTATDDDKVSRERFTALVAAYGQVNIRDVLC